MAVTQKMAMIQAYSRNNTLQIPHIVYQGHVATKPAIVQQDVVEEPIASARIQHSLMSHNQQYPAQLVIVVRVTPHGHTAATQIAPSLMSYHHRPQGIHAIVSASV